MSTYSEAASEAERIAFLKLEKWLIGIARKTPLSFDEQCIGQALITDLRMALGLPPLGPPRVPTEEEIEAGRLGGKVISLVKR